MRAIAQLSVYIPDKKIGLVAVPPSKVNKESSIGTSIWNIENWYNQGITETYFNCEKQIYEYRTLLTRIVDVPTSHESRVRATYEEQISSIACSRDRL